MMSLRERIAWFRAEQYIARYNPYCIAVAGTYGRQATSRAVALALRSNRHVRSGYATVHGIDIPEGILGAKGHREHRSIFHMLVQSKMRELTHFEPDTIISQIPLIKPGAAPWALSRILPRMLVLTHAGLERADLFMDQDMTVHEYQILANTLSSDGVVVLNADDKELRDVREKIHHPVITYGLHPTSDIRIIRASRADGGKGLFLEILVHGKHVEIFLPNLFGKQHVSAVAAGIAAAHGMGISIQEAIESVRLMHPPKGFLSRLDGIAHSTIIDDSTDTCPEQLESSLKTVATLPCTGRKIVVVGDMDHLSSYATDNHEAVGKHISAMAPMAIFVGDMMRHAQRAALVSGAHIDTHHFTSSAEAAAWLPEHVREGDVVFVSGGASMNMKRIVTALQEK